MPVAVVLGQISFFLFFGLRDSPTHPVLITVFLNSQSMDLWESFYMIRYLYPAERLMGFQHQTQFVRKML